MDDLSQSIRFRIARLLSLKRSLHSKRTSKQATLTDEARAGRPLPTLPLEIWLSILREATASSLHPDPLDTYHPISFLDSPHSHTHLQPRQDHYRSAMRQKLDLTLVSKLWNEWAQEVLYEFVWISRASQAKALAMTLLSQSCRVSGAQGGKYIRRLHIETPTLERCCPTDVRTILDYAPRLIVYSDYRSVRRNLYEESCNPRSSPEQLFSALTHANNSLKRLSWTNYDDVSFHLNISPRLETTAANLEYLELNFCSTHLHEMFPSSPPPFSVPPSSIFLTLPALRSLKVTLDNATFSVLSTWSMPALQNLSVLSADFSYAGTGFSQFFIIHGPNLMQLELGHSSSTIEEHYLTTPPHHPNPTNRVIPLAEWCPNLREFICSADAEWNWQHPDWISPHILLPRHPRLQFIGIRDMDKRLRDDMALAPQDDERPFFRLLEQIGTMVRKEAFPSLRYIRDLSWGSDVMRRGGGAVCEGRRGWGKELRVLRFWGDVLQRCRERGVWLEDWRGVNVTARDLRRAEMVGTATPLIW